VARIGIIDAAISDSCLSAHNISAHTDAIKAWSGDESFLDRQQTRGGGPRALPHAQWSVLNE